MFTGSSDFSVHVHDRNHLTLVYKVSTQSTVMAVDYFNNSLVYSTKNGNIRQIDLDINDAIEKGSSLETDEQNILMHSHFAKQE